MKKIKVVAHNGCLNTPDDSLESIQVAINHQADIMEIDIRFNAQSIPVLSHDDLVDGINYVSVGDALALIATDAKMGINLDMKEKHDIAGLKNLKAIIEKFNLKDRVYFSGIGELNTGHISDIFPDYTWVTNWEFDYDGARTKEEQFAEMYAKLHDEAYLTDIAKRVKESGCLGLNLYHEFITPPVAKICKAYDLKLYAWTVESKARIKELIDLGVDAITSRNFTLLQTIVAEKM